NKIESYLVKVEKKIYILNQKLLNNKFIKYAPKIIINDVKNKLEKYNKTKLTLIKQKLSISNYIK
ncbi:MAG: hypothetical protein N4P93_00610, partial [Candidatus Lightella neohaematopini]|nr:hypothetical protein [Candidatus Lightella neohaematopini]